MRPATSSLPRRPLRFALVGVANTLLGLSVIYLAKWLGARDLPANLLGYLAGLTLSYQLNARWTFAFRGPHRFAVPRFILVILAAYVANLITVYGALSLSINSYLAQAAGIVPYTLVGYLGAAMCVFRNQRPRIAAVPRPSSQGE
jgi:putative flippase GtrA